MASKYFIQQGDQTFGTMSGSDVKNLALSGKLLPKDLVWQLDCSSSSLLH